MSKRVLVTGSSGLVGTALRKLFAQSDVEVLSLDLRGEGDAFGDVCNPEHLRRVVRRGVDGVIHLAAVSRVIDGEKNPTLCERTNIDGVRNVLSAVKDAGSTAWVISASSREVYGDPACLPVDEDCPLRPVNIYGRTKVEGENLVNDARKAGMKACIIRLSNVFGSVDDHRDRVVPAFARAAALGNELRVDGESNTFDFTYIDDVARGIVALTGLLATEKVAPPPIHFVSGKPTTLGELATLAIRLAGSGSRIRHAPSRSFDVARFYGSPARARSLLGWEPAVPLEEGVKRLIDGFRRQHAEM